MTPYNRKALLEITLGPIWEQNYPDLEVVVVEDRPTENSLGAYCTRHKIKYDARRSKIEGWMNPAPLLNRGLLMSEKEIVIFQNAEVKHETLTCIADLVTPIIQAQIDQESPLSTSAYVQSLNRDGSFEQWFVHSKEGHRAGWISPFCQALSRASAMKIQGFEESFKAYGYEDDLFEFMLRYSGVRIGCVKEALTSHQYHKRFEGDQRNGNEDIYKRIRREIEVGVRPPVANWGKEWGRI
jgi:GT2 family glycosyltransferase